MLMKQSHETQELSQMETLWDKVSLAVGARSPRRKGEGLG